MHKLIMKAAQGDEKFLMKDINCDYEYDMLKRMRARAEAGVLRTRSALKGSHSILTCDRTAR